MNDHLPKSSASGMRSRPGSHRKSRPWIPILTVLLFGGSCLAGDAVSRPATKLSVESRIAAIEKQIPGKPRNPRLLDEWENLNFYVRKVKYVLRTYRPTAEVQVFLSKDVTEAEAVLRVIQSGGVVPLVPGRREEAYFSEIDASFQPFVRYLPRSATKEKKLPMLVFLHGYSPRLDIANWSTLSTNMLDFAEKEGFCVVAPFGRSNTDYQSIGEQDVIRVINEMRSRYPIDDERIILSGHSMGGMGVWTIGAHYPRSFAGVLVIAGRGDYYFWKGIRAVDLPSYKRTLIDVDFGYSLLPQLKDTPAFCAHGSEDVLIPVSEGRHMVQALKKVNRRVTYVEIPGENHWIEERLFLRPDLRKWLKQQRRKSPEPMRSPHRFLPSVHGPVKKAFLKPFMFVCTAVDGDQEGLQQFRAAVLEWYRYAKAFPRVAHEKMVTDAELSKFNVFVFGAPEKSKLAARILKASPVRAEKDVFVVGRRRFPRKGHGLVVMRPNPWGAGKLAIVQCGLPWGKSLSENHKYDFLPDFIVYSAETDEDGSNSATCAGFFGLDWTLDKKRLYAPDVTKLKQGVSRAPGR